MTLSMKLFRSSLGAAALLLTGCFETGGGSEGDTGGSTGGASDTNAGPTCDPSTFVAGCVDGDIVECSEDGLVVSSVCGPRDRCEIGSEGAACVWRVGEPCDAEYEQCSEPGGILACNDGFWQFDGCPLGGACSDAQCFGPEDTPCEWGEDEPFCDGDSVVSCYPHGFEVSTPCDSEQTCQLGSMGGVCVSQDAVACDPETTISTCADVAEVASCGAAGWTETFTCPQGERCFEGAVAASCADEDLPACDPTTAPAGCEDGVAVFCHPSGYETQVPCDADTGCFTDETCLFGCQELAACVPLDAEPCEEPLDLVCMGEGLAICFAGQILPWIECGCVEDDDGAHCTAP